MDAALLARLLAAVTHLPSTGPQFGAGTNFGSATFTEEASFNRATFAGGVMFGSATFADGAFFSVTTFTDYAFFGDAKFTGGVTFHGATFVGSTSFDGAIFTKDASFLSATFVSVAFNGATFTNVCFDYATFTQDVFFDYVTVAEHASFRSAIFTKDASFDDVTFAEYVSFEAATFHRLERLGPLVANSVVLDRASFSAAVVVEAEAAMMSCRRARFAVGAELRVRYSQVDLSETSFGAFSSLSTSVNAFAVSNGSRAEQSTVQATKEQIFARRTSSDSIDHRPVVLSLRGVDVSDLALTDVDLRWCRFVGAHHLDKLRVEGDSPFPRPPRRWWRASRQVLFEEHLWRAQRRARGGWHISVPGDRADLHTEPVGATRLEALYRSLRKALEDGKNEAGAGDFYYGEQEARRHAMENTSRAERAILWLYWLISGYGQRASRALVALAVLVATVTILLVGTGLPASNPVTQSTTTVQPSVRVAGQQTFTTITDVPVGVPVAGQQWTWNRAENAARIALGAVVFRDSGQKLTTSGTWTVMAARFLGPVLLALAALAIRARVKR